MVLNSGMERADAFVQRAKPSVRLRLTDSAARLQQKEAVTTLQISHAAVPLSEGEPLVFIVKWVTEVLAKLKADLYLPRSK